MSDGRIDLLRLQRDLAVGLGTTSDLSVALHRLLDASLRVEGVDCGGIYLVDRSGTLELAVHEGVSEEFVDRTSHYEADTQQARLVMSGEPLYVRYDSILREAKDSVRRHEGLRAFAVIPVVHEDNVVAVLNVASHTSDEIPESSRTVLETIAAQAGSFLARIDAERATRRSEQRFRLLYEDAPLGYVSLDSDGQLLEANSAWLESLGFSRVDVLGRPFRDFVAPDSTDALRGNRLPLAEGQDSASTVLSLVRRDGTQLTASIHARAVRDRARRVGEVHCIVNDITERVLAERERARSESALRESENRFRAMVQHSSDMVVTVSAAGITDYVSPSAGQMIGYDPEDLAGRSAFDYIHPNDITDVRERLQQSLEQPGKPLRADFRIRHSAGHWVTIETVTVNLLDVPGVNRIVVNARDVTERKAADRALRHSLEKTQRAERLLLALCSASQAVQLARSPEDVYETIGQQIGELGYQAAVLNLSRDRTRIEVAHLAFRSRLVKAAEALTGLDAKGYSWPIVPGGFHERMITSGQTTLFDPAGHPISEALPEPVRSLSRRVAAALKLDKAIYAPLRTDGQVYGMLAVFGTDLAKDDVNAISAFANQAAIALDSARRYGEAQSRSRYLEALQGITSTLRSTLPLDEVLQAIARNTGEALGYMGVFVLLPDDSNDRLVYGAVWGNRLMRRALNHTGLELPKVSVPLSADENPMVVAYRTTEAHQWSGQPERLALGVQPEVGRRLASRISRTIGALGAVCIPLVAADTVLGVLVALSPREHLDDEERALLHGISDQAGLAVRHAQLHAASQQEIVERRQAERQLQYRVAFERLITDISSRFINLAPQDVDQGIENALQDLGVFVDVDRSYVFLLRDMARRMDNSHEWCAPGVEPQQHRLQNLPTECYGWSLSRIIAGQPVPVPRVADLPSEAASEKEEFESEAIKSLVLVPLMHAGSALGFLGLDSVRAERDWSEDTITLLTIVAETFANALVHKRAEAEREQLLEQVQEQARRVERIIHAVPAGVLLLDSNSRVILANPPGEQQLADLADAAVGDTIAALGDRQLSELLAPPPEGLWHELAGATRSYEAIARQMGVEPAPAEWVVVLRDVTEQIEVERRVQQHERLATVGQMAAGMAHDFNNIMAVIILYADMSLRTGEVPEPVLNRLETIKQQAGRASHLIDQMLDFSRRAVLERGPLDLRAFVEEQARLLRRTLPENIRIDVSFGDGDFVVNADPTRMQQAVLNLATNARDAMPDGGTLDFRLERQAVGPDAPPPLPELREGEWVCLTIGDTGTGIAEDVRPKVFEPFFTTKPPGLGTGLGLSQVYGIVMQHEGEIALRDRTGPGTEFRIYLPSTPIDRQSAAHAGEADAPLGSRETILLVEDNEAARAALAGTLALLNYEVVEAASGSEALEYYKARSADIDLVLTDVVMPEMGGPALVRALRDYEPRVRVVMVTGHPLGRESAEKLAALGIRNYVQKPASIEQLATAVAEALAGSSSE